jgi:hypothetical protein
MRGRVGPVGVLLLLTAGGCLPTESAPLVSANPFDDGPRPPKSVQPVQVAHAPASEEAAKRVLRVAEQVRVANPQLALRPLYTTIGAPWEEVFHRNGDEVYITEGLVRRCKTDGELAAVLCHELGKMTAEREALTNPAVRAPDRGPPMDVPVGSDAGGAFGSPDGVRLAERAKYETRRRSDPSAAPAADPDALARGYLEKAVGSANDLDAVAPLLRAADEHVTFEKQFAASPPAPPPTR